MDNNKESHSSDVPPLIDQTKPEKNNERHATLFVDDVAYQIEYEPFFFNDQVRYYVSVNTRPKNVFVWDEEVVQFRAINDGSSVMPVPLEQAISVHLATQNLD